MATPIYPKPAQPTWPSIQDLFGQWLFGQVGKGLPQYPGQLNVDLSKTMLPQVWNHWDPYGRGNQGIDYMSRFLGGDFPWSSQVGNTFQYGGPSGYGTNLMHNMAQWGGTGGPGNYAMSNLLQFGAAGEAGRPLQESAYGGGAALNFLAPFLALGAGGGGYKPPMIPRS